MNRIITTFLLIAGSWYYTYAQQMITLDSCYSKAIENYPLTKQKELLASSNDLKIKNLGKDYLPQLQINGQASYQSDVTKIPIQNIPVFGIEPLSKDWYKITLDANQVIYNGGMTSKQKEIENIDLQIDQQNVDIQLYNLKERVSQIYFNILLQKQNVMILEVHNNNLKDKLKDVDSGVKNGTLLASNSDILKAEIINVGQSISELRIGINTSITMMNDLTGLNLNENTEFREPEIIIDMGNYLNNRLEYSMFSLQQNKLDASKKLIGSKNLPRLFAFGQLGYGRPGFDMLKNQFTDFYIVGAKLNWSFWDWNHTKKEKEILNLQYDIVNTQKETFDKNTRIELRNKEADIRKTEELIKSDKEIIDLRKKITSESSSQLDNGIITSTEYLTILNAQSQAELNLEVHKIQLIKAKIDYQATLGNL